VVGQGVLLCEQPVEPWDLPLLRTEKGCVDWEVKENVTNLILPNYRLSNKSY
jgi:hypothetical protein